MTSSIRPEAEREAEGDPAITDGLTRRQLLAQGLATLLPCALASAARAQNGAGVTAGPPPARRPPRPGSWVVLLGTRGGPGIDLTRSQTASAVVIDGRPYLVDCGYGSVRQLVASNIGYLPVSTVFFTHLHDDHTGDLPALLSYQWTNGKTSATDAYGPYGTQQLVAAAVAFLRINAKIRTVDEGRSIDVDEQFHGHDFPATAEPLEIFKDDRLTVTAIENAHYPERSRARMPYRSLALRMQTKDRSIVFCGDTAYSPNIVKLARGADLFVCEVIDAGVLEEMRRRAREAAARGNENHIYRHVADTHSSPTDVARMAAEASVKTVVLNHQVPGPADALAYPVTAFIEAVRDGFKGEVIVGADLMVL